MAGLESQLGLGVELEYGRVG